MDVGEGFITDEEIGLGFKEEIGLFSEDGVLLMLCLMSDSPEKVELNISGGISSPIIRSERIAKTSPTPLPFLALDSI